MAALCCFFAAVPVRYIYEVGGWPVDAVNADVAIPMVSKCKVSEETDRLLRLEAQPSMDRRVPFAVCAMNNDHTCGDGPRFNVINRSVHDCCMSHGAWVLGCST